MNCLVTGATGFIGRQLCQHLKQCGDRVTALSRSGTPLADGAPTLALDLADQELPDDLFAGIDAVCHLAGIAHREAGAADYDAVNHRASITLARAAARAGVGCFIYLSSVKAMGPPGGVGIRSEGDVAPARDPYGRSKWSAECDLRGEFAGGAMSVVILRPTLVYGPGVAGNLGLLARAVRAGLPRPPLAGERSMVGSPDLVALIARLCHAPPSPGVHTWIVSDGERYTAQGLYDLLRQAAGRGRGRAWLPLWCWRLGANLLDTLRPRNATPTFERLFGTELYSNAALLAATDWRPQCTVKSVAAALVDAGRGPRH